MAAPAFHNFIVTDRSRAAFDAAVAVAHKPREVHNPLVIYGGHGAGKTHLLMAIEQATPDRFRLVRLTTDAFMRGYIASIRDHRADEYTRSFDGLDVFLLDDVLVGPALPRTQLEIFSLAARLLAHHVQVVVTSPTAIAEPPFAGAKQVDLGPRIVGRATLPAR